MSNCPLAVAVVSAAGAGIGLGGAEGVGDAPAGGISLTVDAVGIDVQQNGGDVPDTARPWWRAPQIQYWTVADKARRISAGKHDRDYEDAVETPSNRSVSAGLKSSKLHGPDASHGFGVLKTPDY